MPPFRESPSVALDRVANFRDLGGHTTRAGARVRFGQLFRSGHLAHASAADLTQLAGLGLQRVFDFRTLADIKEEGADRVPEGASHLRLPMPDPARDDDLRAILTSTPRSELKELLGDGKAVAMMVHAAEGLVRDRREPYCEFMTELSRAESYPALFHCSAGKDRAGWAGTVILLALGVEPEQVVEQYLLSNRNLASIRQRLEAPSGQLEAPPGQEWDLGGLLMPFLEVRREYIEASFAALRADWGDFDRYLHEGLGITRAQRAQIEEQLLE